MVLFILRKLILQTPRRSHTVGLDVEKFWSDPLSISIHHVCEQRRLWRVCVDRLSLHCSPMLVGWLCWGLTSQSTIFQSCRDGAIASWVINQYFRGVKCLAQGHNTAAVGLEPRTSRSGVRHSTTEPPRSPVAYVISTIISWAGPYVDFLKIWKVWFHHKVCRGNGKQCSTRSACP